MMRRSLIHAYTWSRARQSIFDFSAGGTWALSYPLAVRFNLLFYWLDGFFANACDNIVATYLTLYLLALGASRTQIGLLSSFSSLGSALLLIPGALLVERLGHRKKIALFGGGIARVALILVASLPRFASGPALVYMAIALAVLRDSFNNLAYPAWMAITADIIPYEGRGRFFASRNFASGASGMVTTLLVGMLITLAVQPNGYQLALLLAFGLGASSTYFFSRLKDPHGNEKALTGVAFAPRALLQDLKSHPLFLALCATTILWNFSLNIAGPFFSVYQVQVLNSSAAMVGITSVASSLSTLLVQRKLGELTDRLGARRLQMISGILIPVLPFLWTFTRAPWHVIPINILSGILWGTYNLASFNFLLLVMPESQRARYSAIYQIITLLSLGVGAAVGGLLVTRWGYVVIFVGSAIGREAAAILFARFAHAPAKAFEGAVTRS